MANDLFSQTKALEQGLSAAWLRNQVIANNIANESTPNFKRSSVEFESLYKEALENQDEFVTKTTNEKHITFDSTADIKPMVVQDTSAMMRVDGNNVDIDYENTELAKNSLLYMTLVEKINSEFARLRMAIKEDV